MNMQSNSGSASFTCPSCFAVIDDQSCFCPACGTKIKEVCQVCTGSMPLGAKFCPQCGSSASPSVTECPNCKGRVNSSMMSYCPQCGVSVAPKCASCGATIIPGWPKCRYCGREIGSEYGFSFSRVRTAADQFQSKIANTDESETTEPESPSGETYALKGTQLFNEERVEEAIAQFKQAIAIEPNNASYHCNLAVAYDEIDQDDDAATEYERTLELNPNEIPALLYYGYMLNESGYQTRAAEMWRKLIEVAPGTAEAEEAEQNLSMQGAL